MFYNNTIDSYLQDLVKNKTSKIKSPKYCDVQILDITDILNISQLLFVGYIDGQDVLIVVPKRNKHHFKK